MAGEELPPVVAQFDANATDFDQVVDHIEERLEVLSTFEATPGVELADEGVEEKLLEIEVQLNALSDQRADPEVGLADDEFEFKLAMIDAQLAALELIDIKIPVELDLDMSSVAATEAAIAAIDTKLKSSELFQLPALTGSLAALAAGTAAGGGGGGGGNAALGAALGFGAGGGPIGRTRIGGILGLGGLAGFGTAGALAGFGVESALTTTVGLAGSGLGALAGGGALALGGAGVAGVGLATDLAGMGQAAGDARNYQQALDTLTRAIAVYGAGSIQAKAAQYDFNTAMQDLSPTTIQAVAALSNATQAFHAQFDAVTGSAEQTGANIERQFVTLAQTFLPTIGQFAGQNMTVIQSSLQPLIAWIQGPGLATFTELEQIFQAHLPVAMDAFVQGIELLIRTLGFLAPMTGGIIADLDRWLTELNGAKFDAFTGEIQRTIDIFHVWAGLIAAVGEAIYELFHHDAGTGTALVQSLTQMVDKFNEWIKTADGGASVTRMLEAHKQEILSILDVLPHLISAYGQFDLIVAPALMHSVAALADLVDLVLKTPVIGQVLAMVAVFELLGKHIGILGALISPLNNAIKSLVADGLVFLGKALTDLGGPFAAVGGAMTKLGLGLQNHRQP